MAYFETNVSPSVKAFITSDALLYSALNLVNILFVVYVTASVPGGTVQSATIALAIGFIARVIVDLSLGKVSSKLSESGKLRLIMLGMTAISLSYIGFALSHNIYILGFLWVINGVGWAIGHPAKLALVAKHINHNQASQEWGLTDALNMTLIVISMILGGWVVGQFSYTALFAFAALINTGGIVPYALYYRKIHTDKVLGVKPEPITS